MLVYAEGVPAHALSCPKHWWTRLVEHRYEQYVEYGV